MRDVPLWAELFNSKLPSFPLNLNSRGQVGFEWLDSKDISKRCTWSLEKPTRNSSWRLRTPVDQWWQSHLFASLLKPTESHAWWHKWHCEEERTHQEKAGFTLITHPRPHPTYCSSLTKQLKLNVFKMMPFPTVHVPSPHNICRPYPPQPTRPPAVVAKDTVSLTFMTFLTNKIVTTWKNITPSQLKVSLQNKGWRTVFFLLNSANGVTTKK